MYLIKRTYQLHVSAFMKAETCSCYAILINYILYIKVVLHYKFIYSLLIIETPTAVSHLKISKYLSQHSVPPNPLTLCVP